MYVLNTFLSSPVSSVVWLQIYWLIMEEKSWEIKKNSFGHLEYVSGVYCLKQPFLYSSLLRWIMEGEGYLSLKHHFSGSCSKEMAKNCVMKWRQYLNCQQELLSLGAAMLPGSPWPSRMMQSIWGRHLHSKYNGWGKVATSEIIQSS